MLLFVIGLLMVWNGFTIKARDSWATKLILFVLGFGSMLISGGILYYAYFL
ncbi:hypothetical protein FC36_GL001562 [Ligilactobacillus equi DSM 15833 = JCM 10991]|uniref:Uncharacterized protein n=1 Tax=Ligilactobacillus equi DSM 15833 = JCM 10991 TaxID=1423740 RepID=A0A0R1TF37_9LACO|nr:hypothetical protein FC36_GL001562 [Ligilactobacillus equi DSM 15833 = JCM 10991]